MPEGSHRVVRTTSADETEALGRALGGLLASGDVVALSGELGAGKTVLVRGVAGGAGSAARVSSPTFTLIREYAGPLPLFHVDLYRLDSAGQLDDLGLDEVLERGGIVLIEWAERAGPYLPGEHLWISITFGPGSDDRDLQFVPRGPRYDEIVEHLMAAGEDRR
jgi:tRNA threonylcarbamoyladenosine biosynthesis protein TsaE